MYIYYTYLSKGECNYGDGGLQPNRDRYKRYRFWLHAVDHRWKIQNDYYVLVSGI